MSASIIIGAHTHDTHTHTNSRRKARDELSCQALGGNEGGDGGEGKKEARTKQIRSKKGSPEKIGVSLLRVLVHEGIPREGRHFFLVHFFVAPRRRAP